MGNNYSQRLQVINDGIEYFSLPNSVFGVYCSTCVMMMTAEDCVVYTIRV